MWFCLGFLVRQVNPIRLTPAVLLGLAARHFSCHCSLQFWLLSSAFKTKIWSLKLECTIYLCHCIFILMFIYNTICFTRLAGSNTLACKFPACMLLCQNKLQIYCTFFFFFSNANTSGIFFCNQVGKKFHKLIRLCLTFWEFSSLWSVIQHLWCSISHLNAQTYNQTMTSLSCLQPPWWHTLSWPLLCCLVHMS